MNILTVDYNSENAPKQFTESLKNTGFAVIKNHPIKFNQINKVYNEWDNFFSSKCKFNYLFDTDNQYLQ